MNADLLLKEFQRISEAPGAVERLRGLILNLAVRGKLVTQDQGDEPAHVLIQRIHREQARPKKNARGDSHNEPTLLSDEIPFRIPETWQWVRLSQVLAKLTDGTHHSPPNGPTGAVRYITAKNIKPDGISLSEITFVSKEVHAEIYARCNPEKGDILYVKDGATTGVVTINDLDEPFSMLSSVALLKLPVGLYNRLIVYFLRSPFFYDQMRGFMKGAAITRVTLKRMAPALLPIPPAHEQHRIVAKIGELMCLCSELEQAKDKSKERRDKLVTSTLYHLRNSADDANSDQDSFKESARFYFRHLPRLTTRPEHIQQLRQAILDLAVCGRLVEQDSACEAASELLKRIAQYRSGSGFGNVSARQTDKEQSGDTAHPFSLPTGWQWAPLHSILDGDSQNGFSKKPGDDPSGVPILRISAGTIRAGGIVAEEEHKFVQGLSANDRRKFSLQKGDLLACRFNGNRSAVGRVALFQNYSGLDPIYPDKLIRLRLYKNLILPALLRYFLNSTLMRHEIEKHCATTVGNWGISATNLKSVPVPVAPLAEQHCILAKVDELMELCERLETQLASNDSVRGSFLEVTIQKALESEQAQSQQTLRRRQAP
jgi:type I restriction enzyme, S subunit